MSLRCPIPTKMREELGADPFMRTCLLKDETCGGRLEWQHSFQYASKRQNELYFILPLCSSHHRRQAKYRREQEDAVRMRIKHFHATESFKEKYPRSNLLP